MIEAAATSPKSEKPTLSLASLNARTAKRQQLLLAGVGALLLAGGSWFIFGSDNKAEADKTAAAQAIDTVRCQHQWHRFEVVN